MFPFRRKTEKRQLPPKPPWLKWLLLFFILYGLFLISTSKETKQSFEQAQKRLEKNELVNIDGYKDKLFPEHGAGLRIKDVAEGTGRPAVCGQHVAIAYQSFLAQGNEIADTATREKPLRFTIGDGNVMPVFDRGVIGMKTGGKRSIVAPPTMAYGMENYTRDDVPQGTSIRMEMELLSAEPALPEAETMPYRIADVAIGSGNMLICGETTTLRVKLWDLTGKLLYTNAQDKDPITLTPGKAEAMLGLEQGILGMIEGGTRLLIIPPAFQKTMDGGTPKISLPLPESQTVMVEVEAHGPPVTPSARGDER